CQAEAGGAREGWYLAKREVFGKPPRRQVVEGARHDREKRAPGRMGSSRAALEVGRHAGTLERVLEQTDVLLRRAQRNRHAIERDAATRFVQNPARDFDCLAPFARRGKEFHLLDRIARRWWCRRKQIVADPFETWAFRRAKALRHFLRGGSGAALQGCDHLERDARPLVTVRHRGECLRR